MSSISILPNPKAYANANFNNVQLYGLQDLTNPVAGNILVSDASGNFTSQSGGGAGFVTSVIGQDASITTASTSPGVVKVNATGNFLTKNLITSGTLGAGASTLGATTVTTLGASSTVSSAGSLSSGAPFSSPGLVQIGTSVALTPAQVLGGAIQTTETTPITLTLPSGTGAGSLDSTAPSGFAVNGNGFLWLVSNAGSSTVAFSNSASFQMGTSGISMAAGSTRIFYVVRSAGNWVAV